MQINQATESNKTFLKCDNQCDCFIIIEITEMRRIFKTKSDLIIEKTFFFSYFFLYLLSGHETRNHKITRKKKSKINESSNASLYSF